MLKMVKRIIKRICRKVGFYDTVEKVYVRRFDVAAGSELLGKKILITGGSSGIGLAIAKKCLAQGAEVVITGRDEKKLNSAVKEIANERLKSIVWDINDLENLKAHIARVETLLDGDVDIVINNAGISIREMPGTLTENVWDRIFASNLKAPVFIAQTFANRWIANKSNGVILNISSMAGIEPALDAYSSSKCALNSITKGMARTWAKHGIRINAIAAGVTIGTNLRDIQRSIKPDGDVSARWIPSGRYAVPDEIAESAEFLISNRSSYVTGEIFVCDGAGAIR